MPSGQLTIHRDKENLGSMNLRASVKTQIKKNCGVPYQQRAYTFEQNGYREPQDDYDGNSDDDGHAADDDVVFM